MNKKKRVLMVSLAIIALLTTPYIQNIKAESNTIKSPLIKNTSPLEEDINILVYFSGTDGTFERNIITLSKNIYNTFLQKISDISNIDITLEDLFEQKLQLMKEYGIIPEHITLADLLDYSKIQQNNLLNFSIIQAHKFESKFAPIFIAGMGFGLGIGFRRMPVRQHLAGNLFSAGLIGLGAVVCLDIEHASLYYQYTFTYPYLIHVLSGFIGIMLFAFDSRYPPENGPPLTIYSNFLALGMAGLAIGFEFPPQ